jgi:SAM-dependent methyltransferase
VWVTCYSVNDFLCCRAMKNSRLSIPVHTSGGLLAMVPRPIHKVASSCANSLAEAEQRVFERLLGVSTTGVVYTDHCITTAGGDYVFYQNCGWLPVRRMLKDLAPGPSDVFVDLGSGKGQALLIAGRLPYRRVVGVEMDEEFSQCAKRNVERARPRLRAQEVNVVTANVLEWPIPDDASVVFMFNPFIGQTFRTAVGRIFESFDRRPRTLHIVYSHPWEHNWLLSTGRVVVDNLRPMGWPAFPSWWRGECVMVSYRVVGALEGSQSEPRLPRRIFRPRQAIRRWSSPNDQRFALRQPGQETVYSRS